VTAVQLSGKHIITVYAVFTLWIFLHFQHRLYSEKQLVRYYPRHSVFDACFIEDVYAAVFFISENCLKACPDPLSAIAGADITLVEVCVDTDKWLSGGYSLEDLTDNSRSRLVENIVMILGLVAIRRGTVHQTALDILNKNALEVTLGEKSRTEAVRDTIRAMSDKGIPAFVDAAGREWSPEAYVNMDIRNTAKNAALMSEFESAKELGQDVILVSSHAAARPLCAPYQGKFYSLSGKAGTITDAYGKEYTYEPLSSTSYGEPAGLFGINCGHTFRGVEDGLFVNNEEIYDEKENSEEYEKVQKQRALERDIRKNKMKRDALKAAGDDEGAREYDLKVRQGNKRMNEYCAENGLAVRKDRTQVYGYSDPGRKKKREDFVETLDKSEKNSIINYRDSIADNVKITNQTIMNVPDMTITGSSEIDLRHRNASRELLRHAKALPEGYEMSIIYDADMRRINGHNYVIGEEGKVNIEDHKAPYHAFHNHPSDKSFSFPDIRGMVLRKNMLSLTAQGNAGSKYVMMRNEHCDTQGYFNYLDRKSKQVFYTSGKTYFSLDYVHDRNKEAEVKNIIASLSDSDREGLHKALRRITDECIEEGGKYGFEYKFQSA